MLHAQLVSKIRYESVIKLEFYHTFFSVAWAMLGFYPKKQLQSFPHPGNTLVKTQCRLIPNLARN